MSMWVLVFGLALPVGAMIAGPLAHAFGTATILRWQGIGSIAALFTALVTLTKQTNDLDR